MARLLPLFLTLFIAGSLFSTPITFTPGHAFWASQAGNLYKIPSAGNYSGLTPFASLTSSGNTPISMTFKPDLTVAYVSIFNTNQILAVTPSGSVSVFATGINKPSGLVWTTDGKLLVASYQDGKVFNITAGGNFSGATSFASGLTSPRYMAQTSIGVLAVTSAVNGKVFNLGAGGNLAAAIPFASNIYYPYDIVEVNNKIYVSTSDTVNKVLDITSGGSMTGKPSWATGQKWAGLAAANGKLYGSTDHTINPGGMWDITNGGAFSSSNVWASGLPGAGTTVFEFVPALVSQGSGQQTPSVPEANSSLLLGTGLLLVWLGRTKKTA